MNHLIIWFTGQMGSGKTTLANALRERIGGIILDGDDMRASISQHAGFGAKDRHAHNIRVAKLAKVLSRYSLVIVAVIAPFKVTRQDITNLINPVWIYVDRGIVADDEHPYEIPTQYSMAIDTLHERAPSAAQHILEYLRQHERYWI